MKVLFAVSTEEIAEKIMKTYQKEYKEIISSKNVYYFNAIIKELQRNQTYDRIVISEDLEPFTNNNFDEIDRFIFEKLDGISDEAIDNQGRDIPIVVICSERREKSDKLLVKLFSIGIYDALVGNDRTIDRVSELLNKPRTKKEAKMYYKIEQGETVEDDKNVSEIEIQNILSHYRRLGKNEDKYVESFDNIAEQYTDEQLKIIIKFLPIEVKAVLEANSPKYQSIMVFSPLKKEQREEKKNNLNVSKIIGIKPKNITGPVIIPKTINVEKAENVTADEVINTSRNEITNNQPTIKTEIKKNDTFSAYGQNNIPDSIEKKVSTFEDSENDEEFELNDYEKNNIKDLLSSINGIEEAPKTENLDEMIVGDIDSSEIEKNENIEKSEEVQPVKRGRGRPKKIIAPEDMKPAGPKRGRGRPRKNPLPEENILSSNPIDESNGMLPGFEVEANDSNDISEIKNSLENDITELPGIETEDTNDIQSLPGFDNDFDNTDELPGLDTEKEDELKELPGFEEDVENNLPGFEADDTNELPGFEEENVENLNDSHSVNEDTLSGYDDIDENEELISNSFNRENHRISNLNNMYDDKMTLKKDETERVDISHLLTQDKKVVAFVGTSKNGVSFLVNSVADILANKGIKTAIVDLTRNKNSYYIYTENKEELREIAYASMEGLKQGRAEGIEVNRNLTVYTSSPNIRNTGYSIEAMLTTLAKNYSLVILDCDYSTNKEYFRAAQEIYLVQSMDVLTIQPLTEFLRKLKLSEILETSKLKAVINKAQRVRGLNEEMIVGGMSTYNDPEMSIQDRLFDMKTINKIIIPFDETAYSTYLSGVANCEISVKGYNKTFLTYLRKLADQVYPEIAGYKRNDKKYNNVSTNVDRSGTKFSSSMSNTLDQMKRQYK